MKLDIFKPLIGVIIFSLVLQASPIAFNPQDVKNITTITLPSGIEINTDISTFCEAGCDEVIAAKSNRKYFLLLAGLAIIPFLKRCSNCCETCCLVPPPTGILPPVSQPPIPTSPPTEIPEPETIFLLFAGLFLFYLLNKHGINNTSRSSTS